MKRFCTYSVEKTEIIISNLIVFRDASSSWWLQRQEHLRFWTLWLNHSSYLIGCTTVILFIPFLAGTIQSLRRPLTSVLKSIALRRSKTAELEEFALLSSLLFPAVFFYSLSLLCCSNPTPQTSIYPARISSSAAKIKSTLAGRRNPGSFAFWEYVQGWEWASWRIVCLS